MTESGEMEITPFAGSVKGVQCDGMAVEVAVVLWRFHNALPSIL